MKIELRKLKIAEHMSEETTAFTADIFIDGVNAGYAKNSGQGGCTDYHCNPDQKSRDLINKAEEFCLALPDQKFEMGGGRSPFVMKMNLENFIDELVNDELKRKDVITIKKKLAKKQLTHIMWGRPDFTGQYTEVNFKRPLASFALSPAVLLQLQTTVDKYKASFKEGDVFWNTNLETLGIKI